MTRKLVWTGVWLGLLGGAGALAGQEEASSYEYVEARDAPVGAERALRTMGDRLQVEGKERLELVGTLTQGGQAKEVRILWESPGKVRIEKRKDDSGKDAGGEEPEVEEVVVYNGRILSRTRGTVGTAEQDLIEMLVHDSVEGFFLGQKEGLATRFLGSRLHRRDSGGGAVGPDYDIYQVTDEVGVSGSTVRQRKRYYFNSDTALMEKVRYRLDAARGRGVVAVEVEVSSWGEVDGQLVPTVVVRSEDGVEVVRLEVREAGVSAGADDGSFTLD